MNVHITSYLDKFIKLDSPTYAVLLQGKWGSGKTHFIKSYIDNNQKNTKYVYVSLFGLKETSAIDMAVFEELHPILSSKTVKIANTVLRGAVKLGLKVDINGNGTDDASINSNIKLDSLLDFFDKEKKSKNVVFVFDDLERTLIDMVEVLGYINSLVETSKLKVILIANEEEINDKDNYLKFKEKTINKTYQLVNNNKEIFNSIVSKNQAVNKHRNSLSRIFDVIGKENYRVLVQVIDNYEEFKQELPIRFKNNSEFMQVLIAHFFIYSFEYKLIGSFDDVQKSLQKCEYHNYQVFDLSTWKKILQTHNMIIEEISQSLEISSFFRPEIKTESWIKLWSYQDLSQKDFYHELKDMINKFNGFYYEKPAILIHVISLLLFFLKKDIKNIPHLENIKEQSQKYIDNHTNDKWISDRKINRDFNTTGYAYRNFDDKNLKKIIDNVNEKMQSLYNQNQENELDHFENNIEFLLENGNFEEISKIIESKYRYTSYLHKWDLSKLVDNLFSKDLFSSFSKFIEIRYPENHYDGNDRPISFYVIEETEFLAKLIKLIQYKSKDSDNFLSLKADDLTIFLGYKLNYLEKIREKYNLSQKL